MSMFGQVGALPKRMREAKKMQKEMRKVKVTGRSKDESVRMYFNGAQELENVTIDDELLNPDSVSALVDGIKEAHKDYQKKLQKEMTKDLDMDQLRDILGG